MRVSVLIFLLPASLAAYGGILYYRLAWLHLQSRRALRHVDEQLCSHHEHIPHFLIALSGYVEHEREIIERVIQARMRSLAATTLEERLIASAHLSHSLYHLFRISETCTMTHNDDQVTLAHMEVMMAEQKIALAREYYNHVIEHYNRRLQEFPSNLVGKLAGFQPKTVFDFPEYSNTRIRSTGMLVRLCSGERANEDF